MTLLEIEACAQELAWRPTRHPRSPATTRSMRRARAEQLSEIRTVVESGGWARGYRSPAAWSCDTTSESYGQCTFSLHLAKTIVRGRDRTMRPPLIGAAPPTQLQLT